MYSYVPPSFLLILFAHKPRNREKVSVLLGIVSGVTFLGGVIMDFNTEERINYEV